MPQRRHSLSGFCAAIGVLALLAGAPAAAADSQAAKNAEQYLAKGNLKAAAIELQNAIREAPQDG